MEEKQLMEGRKGREKYLEEWLRRGRPSRLVSRDFDKREPCAWHARDDTVFRLSVGPSIHHYRHNQQLLLLKYWPGHDVCNRTLEINLSRTPLMIEALRRIMLLSSCLTSTIKDNIHVKLLIQHRFLFSVLDVVNLHACLWFISSLLYGVWLTDTACVTYCLSFVLRQELKWNLSTDHISAINERGVTDLLDTFIDVGG